MTNIRKAMTLAEVLIAMSITSVIGLSVAGVATALSSAHAGTENGYANIQTGRSAMVQVQRELNRARLITAMDSDEIVYWAQDSNGDAQMNVSEMAVLEYDPKTDTLVRHEVVFPANMDPATRAALDSSLTLATMATLSSASSAVEKNARCQTTTVAENVSSFKATPWPASPMTTLVRLEMTCGEGEGSTAIQTAAALRVNRTDCIAVEEGAYVLKDAATLDNGASE